MPKFNIKDLMVSLEQKGVDTLCVHFTGCLPIGSCFNHSCFGVTPICYLACSHVATVICPNHTVTFCPNNTKIFCYADSNVCPGGSIWTPTTDLTTPWKDPEILGQIIPSLDAKELTELKAALQGLVAKVDTEFKPAKMEQLNNLEEKLNEALQEVKEQKKKL